MQLVLHAPLGGRINRAWGLALRKKFCRTFDFELQAQATDDGIVISLGQPHSFPLESVFGFVPSKQAKDVLVQALLDRPMFEIRWRWNVTRSLTVLRRKGGKKVAPHLIKMRAADTLSVVFPQAQACVENIPGDREIPDHPLVFETIRDCLVEAMDCEGFIQMCARLESGEIQFIARDTVEPSPLSHELLNANPYAFLDDAPRGSAHACGHLGASAGEIAHDRCADLDAIARRDEVRRRDADELVDAQALWLVPMRCSRAGRRRGVIELCAPGARCAGVGPRGVGRDRRPAPPGGCPAASRRRSMSWHGRAFEPEDAMVRLVAGQLDHRTITALAGELGLPVDRVVAALVASRPTARSCAAGSPRHPRATPPSRCRSRSRPPAIPTRSPPSSGATAASSPGSTG
jgi:ATP-dependent Lhr-like helicase